MVMSVEPPQRYTSPHSYSSMTEPTNIDHVITAKRSRDGSSFTFDVSISHIIEQTLLRSLNRPNFRKSTIRLVDESDMSSSSSESTSPESSNTADSKDEEELAEKEPIKIRMKRKYAEQVDPSTGETSQAEDCGSTLYSSNNHNSLLSARAGASQSDYSLDQPLKKNGRLYDDYRNVTPIPRSWMERGLTKAEHRQIRLSIENASVCPHQRKRLTKDSDSSVQNMIESGMRAAAMAHGTGTAKPSHPRMVTDVDHTAYMDCHLAYMLSSIEGREQPTQKPRLNVDQLTEFKYRDLVGTVIEKQLKPQAASSEDESPTILSL